MDPNNMKASEGLHRLRFVEAKITPQNTQKQTEAKIQETPKVTVKKETNVTQETLKAEENKIKDQFDSGKMIKELEVKKEKANDFFRKSVL